MAESRLTAVVSTKGAERAKENLRNVAKSAKAANDEVLGLAKGSERASKSVSSSSSRMESSFRSLKSGALPAISGVAKALGALAAASGTASVIIQKDFEQSLADLSAITGATGKDLSYLEQQARRLGSTTEFSASQAAEGFKLIASAKPDLLENAQALSRVTEQALLLASASGTTLPEAAATVGTALNQFGEEADQAARFVNVLAAGAKLGASEVVDTAEALKNAGVSAKSAGVSFEETNAAIQILAASGVKGAEAGTALRNIFLKLDTDADNNLRPSIVGLSKALDNLNSQNLDSADLVKKFGLENISAATTVLQNRKAIEELTVSLTGTNTALDQASTKSDTLKGDFLALKSAAEGLGISIGKNANPAVRLLVQELTDATRQADFFFSSLVEGSSENITSRMADIQDEIKELEQDLDNASTAGGRLLNVLTFSSTDTSVISSELEKKRSELKELREQYKQINDLVLPTGDEQSGAPSSPVVSAPAESPSDSPSVIAAKERAKLELAVFNQLNESKLDAINRIEMEQIDLLNSLQDERLITEQERLDALTEITLNAAMRRGEIERSEIEKTRQAEKEAAEARKAQEEQLASDRLSVLGSTTQALKSTMGEQSAIYKAAAITQATIDTYKAANAAYAALAGIPIIGPGLGAAAAGVAIGAGIANVREISSARYQGGSLGAGQTSTIAERGELEVITPASSSRVRTAQQMKSIMGESGGGTVVNMTIIDQASGGGREFTQETNEQGDMIILIRDTVSADLADNNSKITKSLRANNNIQAQR